jgi:chromate transporter
MAPVNIYLDLYWTFFKIGLFTFGGGYAMLPMLESECVTKKKWCTYDQLMDYFAIGQCTPGVIAVNTATFMGYSQKKVPGAIVATLGIISPSLIIISLIASVLTNFASIPMVQHALAGIRIAVCVLILNATIKLFKNGVKNSFGVILFLIALLLSAFNLISVVWIVVAAAAAGIIYSSAVSKKQAAVQTGSDMPNNHNTSGNGTEKGGE